ncbi:MAG: type II CAAX endopeptidase family protein [Erysipelotrichaceae bacterium]
MKQSSISAKSPLSTSRVVIILVLYFIAYNFVLPLILGILAYFIKNQAINSALEIAYILIMMVVFIVLVFPILKESYLTLKDKPLKTLFVSVKTLPALFLVSVVFNYLAMFMSHSENSANQTALLDYFKLNPISVLLQAIIFAPIVEELIFRGVIYRHFLNEKNMLKMLIISSMAFGSIHVITSLILGNYADLWYLPTYMAMGLVIAYTYEKTQSIYACIFLHFLNNSISILLMISNI